MELTVIKQALKQDLESTGVHPSALNGTSPTTAWLEVFGDDDGRDAGIWECSPGKYRLECRQFFLYRVGFHAGSVAKAFVIVEKAGLNPLDQGILSRLGNISLHVPYVDFFKIASYELLWNPLLKKCAESGLPVVLS